MPTEDEIYRSSSQFRLWNFNRQRLSALRKKTNTLARDHVRIALKRKRTPPSQTELAPKPENGSSTNGNGEANSEADQEIDFLTVDEEKTLVDFFCLQLLNMAQLESFNLPTNVTATAIQLIKRFYITNSVMSYHPRQIMITALYLATKIENMHLDVRSFASRLSEVPGLESVTSEEVTAPEYILVQGLRFCFDVRHPHRALKGAYIELQMLLSLARGDAPPKSWKPGAEKELQKHLLHEYNVPAKFQKRIDVAYQKAREMLQRAAVLSDAYFLYTPAQIAMAAMWIADRKIVQDLLHVKMSVVPDLPDGRVRPVVERILNEVESCAHLLQATDFNDSALKKDAVKVDRKLHFCRNPEKVDLVKLNQAQKRDATEYGKLDESLAKKRKLERERIEKEGDDLFGPVLKKESKS